MAQNFNKFDQIYPSQAKKWLPIATKWRPKRQIYKEAKATPHCHYSLVNVV
ncbi:hypothetical protein COLO4_22105 [Corchorus olitorius]|uniref:Uncharacterized protein n=1 Tax=Corchorus olitorius TaxID=93759 RepID=A0A1R3IP45_9ROSI|nr:hypothetical protein COLO4_22105 [Corchorus olitorius]